MKLPEMQKKNMKCVFCKKSNQKVEGGYFKSKFICRKCDQESKNIDFYLGVG